MDQAFIAAFFRKAELERRRDRRNHLLALWESEAKLLKEELDPAAYHAHRSAIADIQAQELIYQQQTEVSLGYWKRLWYALINKKI